MIKKAIRSIVNSLGYDIVRKNRVQFNLSLYNKLYCELSIKNRCFYNIGAGNFYHPYWTNVDHESEWYKANNDATRKGIDHDLLSLDPLLVDDSCAEAVYTSHTIEHITDEAAQKLFDESMRILKRGAVLRIVTPNIDLAYRALMNHDRSYFYWSDTYSQCSEMERIKLAIPLNDASLEQLFIHHFASSVSTLHSDGSQKRVSDDYFKELLSQNSIEEVLNICKSMCEIEIQKRYPGNHINWWNAEKLKRMLVVSGFGEIFVSGHGQSYCPVMRNTSIFDTTHPKMSLYIEAIKR